MAAGEGKGAEIYVVKAHELGRISAAQGVLQSAVCFGLALYVYLDIILAQKGMHMNQLHCLDGKSGKTCIFRSQVSPALIVRLLRRR